MIVTADVLALVEQLAPRYMKMDWDNVGLLCGSRKQPVKKILVALDPFEGVCQEAAQWGADVIVTHHPLIFKPLSNVTDDTTIGRSVQLLCRSGISAINAHTNLDCVPGGVNDILARKLELQDVQVIDPMGTDETGNPWGLLRMGTVREQTLEAFLPHIKQRLGCQGLRYADGGKPVYRVAVGGGACSGEMVDAIRAGCDTFVTSDIKYNQFWDAKDLGLNLIDAGHFHTENPVTEYLAEKLREAFPEVEVKISETHTDCMKFF
ncbi:MAG: Nif3-like dinuclear metal center hexameric protein [Oscillospiraceae bacterium]|nr:Nif3-like dinuclear metal center hexameric protein [Oscillospiraceae bacterium]